MRSIVLVLALLLPLSLSAKDVTRTYTFPDKSYTVTFPCIGKLERQKSIEETYDRYSANMFCDELDQTYTVQYFKFHNLTGLNNATLDDKHYFLREFRDMVRKIYMGDYDDFLTENETKASVLGFPALRFDLVSQETKNQKLKIKVQAVMDQNNALYFSSIFVKDRENIYNIKEFFDSLRKGQHE